MSDIRFSFEMPPVSASVPSAKDAGRNSFPLASAVTAAVGFAALVFAYGGTLAGMVREWDANPQYSHGFLVPAFALALLWLRRDQLRIAELRPDGWGVAVLTAGLIARHLSAFYYIEWFEQLSLIVCVVGVALLAGGRAAIRWSWPACLFLVFMVPLPFRLETALREPLRRIGTVASTYVMQTAGLPAYAEGTVIVIDDVRIGVVEACSGLRMLMVFFALATAVAIVSKRALWQRGLIVLSAVPVALLCNVARITVTGALYSTGYAELADLVFHDLAGWLMMPLALAMLWLLTAVLDRLILVEAVDASVAPAFAFAGATDRTAIPDRRPVRA